MTDPRTAPLALARWEIRPRDGSPPVRGDLRALRGPAPTTAVVLCHGFKGFKDWGFFPPLARALARRGHAVVSFNFSGSGVGEDGVDFSALDLFAGSTHSRNVEEIGRVIDAVWDELLPRPPRRLGLFGHSRGGGEAVLAAARDPRVDALVTWSAISTVDRWPDDKVTAWERGETVEIPNARTGQAMPMAPSFWRDIRDNRRRLDITGAAARVTAPWLIVHGDRDESVAVGDAHALFDAAGEAAELLVVDEASHTFGAAHPFAGSTPELKAAAEATVDWFDRLLE